ncbi:MAG: hypothetical protein R3200_04315, partial [Xanthomonadales bacterium]|nr:hypothetical protein [Xanthomonadales bacterium]
MKSPAILIFLALLLTGCASRVDDRFEDERWRQYPSPEAAGFSDDALEPAFQAATEAGSVAVMAVHRGR